MVHFEVPLFSGKETFAHLLTTDIVLMRSYSNTTNLFIDASIDIDIDADFY